MAKKSNMREVGGESEGVEGSEPSYNPPSYDYATGGDGASSRNQGSRLRKQPIMAASPAYAAMPSPSPQGARGMVHHYQHPVTGHIFSTVLPPDHPEMVCLQEGRHIRTSRFGILGILAAVFWFPLGIGLCLLDRRVVCSRCGNMIDGGISC
ncbi:hypothetical protein M0805_002027 [Coniferiporia weirii]|nr:hypothetical protein M0805_002027 [Coniferiporia weirii]